jgi:hypothetical protein
VIGTGAVAHAVWPMTLVEEVSAIYASSSGDASAVPAAVAAVSYLPSSTPFLVTAGVDIGVSNGADVTATALLNDALVIGTAAPTTVGDLITAANTASASPVAPKAITALGASAALDVVIPASGSRAFSADPPLPRPES